METKYCEICNKKLFAHNKHKTCMNCRSLELYNRNNRIIMKCEICGFKGLDLSSHIRCKHNISVSDYKNKFNVKKVCIQSNDRKNKIRIINLNRIVSEDVKKQISKTLKKKHKLKLIDTKSYRTVEWIEKQKQSKLKLYKEYFKYKEKISSTLKRKYKTGEIKVWNKGLTKDTDNRVKKLSLKIKDIQIKNPKLQINYRLAQKRKKGEMFGGEARLNWVLKRAGFIEGKDYKYNKSIKVYDAFEKRNRVFYPDFIFSNNYMIEVDGVSHFDLEGKYKKYDFQRERILQMNGCHAFMRIKHEKLFNKDYLHNLIVELKWWRNVLIKDIEREDLNYYKNQYKNWIPQDFITLDFGINNVKIINGEI